MGIRTARADDAAHIADAHVRSWQDAYRGLLPQDFLDRLESGQRLSAWQRILAETDLPRCGTLVADTGGCLSGFVNFGPVRDQDADPERVGEVRAIYLRPEAWGQGLGRTLMAAAATYLTEAGFEQAVLWVLDSNARARGFYEAVGWTADGATRDEDMPGFTLTEVRYRRSLP